MDDTTDFKLHLHGRYAHAREYVEGAIDKVGIAVHSLTSVVLRNEGQQPVAGHLVVAKKYGSAA